MIGERLAQARKRAGLSQFQLALEMGERYDRSMIGHAEHNRTGLLADGLVKAAQVLAVSTDYLLGLTDDPTPAGRSVSGIAETRAKYETEGQWRDVPVREVKPAAGSGAETFGEEVIGYLPFRRDWLQERGIDPGQADVVPVSGVSMEPTLPDGCSILVDRKRREPIEGRLYVMRTEDGLVVKRLDKDKKGRWLVVSDNPDWPPGPLRYGTEIIGEVRWIARTL